MRARRAAENVADFEILQQFARHRRRHADHRRHASTATTPLVPETPSETISSAAITSVESVSPEIGLLDEPITPTRYPETVAKKKPTISITIAAAIAAADHPGHIDVQHAHQQERHADQREDRLRTHVPLGAAQRSSGAGAAPLNSAKALPRPGDQVLAHAEQRVARAHHHAAHRDRPHDVAPHGVGQAEPVLVARRPPAGTSATAVPGR